MNSRRTWQTMSRREFLKVSALATGTSFLAACVAPSSAPAAQQGASGGQAASKAPVEIVVWYQDLGRRKSYHKLGQTGIRQDPSECDVELAGDWL